LDRIDQRDTIVEIFKNREKQAPTTKASRQGLVKELQEALQLPPDPNS